MAFPGKSHWNYVSAVLRVLTNNGHHVTVFTPFLDGERDNYTEIDTSNDHLKFLEWNLIDTMDVIGSPTTMVNFMRTERIRICDAVYKNAELNKIMEEKENSNFDVLFIETLGYDCELYMASKLNLPLIYLVTSPMATIQERVISGDIPNPATISHLYAHYAIPKTFMQRLSNTVLLAYNMMFLSVDKCIRKYIIDRPYNWVTNIVQPSMTFVNSHFISEASRPFPPNVVQVGGIHLEPPKSIPNVS
eukprot:XP_008180824.1 PREDICTED: UDP-glucuronosyltransferase 2B15-like [Acyrthosiphon pisum]